jgi:hypothetical protein
MEEVGIVTLLPNENQVCSGHEDGHEVAAGRRTRKRIRPDAEPAAVVGHFVVRPELLDRD